MTTTDTVVIGAGHAGLAVSRLLTAAGHEHVVLDRGGVGHRWSTERWDSLHLLTPNWMTRLPGWLYTGADQEDYMSAAAFVRYLELYAGSFGAPVQSGTTVEALSRAGSGYDVATDRGSWRARNVVIATGPWARPHVPEALEHLHGDVQVVTSNRYRNPARLPAGGVLVVGASASGVQIADELNRAGRRVVLAVGGHSRMPRRYRGMDIYWWLERTGRLSRTIDEVPDPQAARREPSLQLVGRNTPQGHSGNLDLVRLRGRGVQLAGRLDRVDGTWVRFRDDLALTTKDADQRMNRFLDAVDRNVEETALTAEVWSADRPRPMGEISSPEGLDLRAEGIESIVLAAGFRPDYPWLRLPITGQDGVIRQHRGITEAPGVYVVGQRFQHRRDSSFIDGARHDARAVVGHLRGDLSLVR